MSNLTPQFTRRSAVVGGGAAVCACAVSACGNGSSSAKNTPVDVTVPASSVPVGGGYVDSKANVVISQTAKGTYKAFSAVCTHQGCTVGAPQDGTISCPCHGSQFDAATGAVKAGPANAPLAAKKVAIQGTNLHITG